MQERIVQNMVMMMVNHWTWAQIRLRPDRIDHVHHRLGIILLLHHRHGILTLGNLEINGKDGQIQVTANGVAGSPLIIVDRVTKTDSLVRKMTCSLALLHLCDWQDPTEFYQIKDIVLCECIVLSFHGSGARIHARKTLLEFNKRPCIFMHDLWNKKTDLVNIIFLCRYRLYPTWVDLKDLKTHVTTFHVREWVLHSALTQWMLFRSPLSTSGASILCWLVILSFYASLMRRSTVHRFKKWMRSFMHSFVYNSSAHWMRNQRLFVTLLGSKHFIHLARAYLIPYAILA